MMKQKEKESVTLISGTIVAGEARKMGETMELPIVDARYLVASGKAVPKGDDREKDIKALVEKRTKAEAKK